MTSSTSTPRISASIEFQVQKLSYDSPVYCVFTVLEIEDIVESASDLAGIANAFNTNLQLRPHGQMDFRVASLTLERGGASTRMDSVTVISAGFRHVFAPCS